MKVRVYLTPNLGMFFRAVKTEDRVTLVKSTIDKYLITPVLDLDTTFGTEEEEAAEEMFDLSNNPSREDERAKLYYPEFRLRSVSTGDVVEIVDTGNKYMCDSIGWVKL